MPQVFIKRNPDAVSDTLIKQIANALPEIVANALSVEKSEGANVTANEVEVTVTDHGRFDVNTHNLEIMILANDHPGRVFNLRSRNEQIVKDLRKVDAISDYYLGFGNEAFVKTFLMQGAFKML